MFAVLGILIVLALIGGLRLDMDEHTRIDRHE